MTFGRGGWASAIDRPGLGITIRDEKIKPLILQSQSFPIGRTR